MANYGQCICIVAVTASALSNSACSLLFTTKPPPDAASLPAGSVACTSSKVAPIMDSGAAIGMGIALIRLAPDDPRNVVISRGADIGIMTGLGLLFLTSAIYGYEVTTRCHDLKRGIIKEPSAPGAFPAPLDEEEKRRARRREPDPFASFAASPEARPVDLPKTVGGFAFAITPAEAQKICAATGRVWEQQGVNANCRPKTEGSGDETARLEFDLGSLTKIAIVHAPGESSFNKSYETLHTKLKIRYGTPQVRRAPLSGDCANALPECLKRGETFKGSTWGLPAGRVDLVPVWRDQHALLEERYTREQAPAE